MRNNLSRLAIVLTLAGAACSCATTTTGATTSTATTRSAPQTQTATASSLPAGRALIDRYVQAIGGRDAVLRRTTIRYVGTMEIPAAGAKGDLTLEKEAPNKMAMTVNMGAVGQM